MKKGSKLKRIVLYNYLIDQFIIKKVYFSDGKIPNYDSIFGLRYSLHLYLIGWL